MKIHLVCFVLASSILLKELSEHIIPADFLC